METIRSSRSQDFRRAVVYMYNYNAPVIPALSALPRCYEVSCLCFWINTMKIQAMKQHSASVSRRGWKYHINIHDIPCLSHKVISCLTSSLNAFTISSFRGTSAPKMTWGKASSPLVVGTMPQLQEVEQGRGICNPLDERLSSAYDGS